MSRILLAIALVTALLGCDTTVRRSEMDAVDYGPKPERWREEIRSYLGIRLNDPKNAVVEFRSDPKIMYQKESPLRARQFGWAVCVWINDKNRAGGYDGFYPMTVFLRNEKVVAEQRSGRLRRGRRAVRAPAVRRARLAVQRLSRKSAAALVRPIFSRSASLIGAASNQRAAWSMFSNGQSVENMMRSAPSSSMASISVCVRKLPEVVSQKFSWKYSPSLRFAG